MTNPQQEAIIDAILADSLAKQEQKGPDLRQLHPKSHGLLWGEFIIEENLPETLQVGVFKTVRNYPVWIRFSNAGGLEERGKFKPDKEPDVRGMAIKLMNVEGEKVLDDEEKTQDFVLVNSAIFFLRNLQGYVDLAKLQKGELDPASMSYELGLLAKMNAHQVSNPLSIHYWSTTSYQLGNQAIKFSVSPHSDNETSHSPADSENYLREAIVNQLTTEGKDAYFDFLVQLYVNDEKTPIEDSTIEWQQTDSPFVKVATIKIPSQIFNTEERKRLDEGLSFTPWHTLPEHQPLGVLNLARKKIYQEATRNRREHIQQRLREPQPYDQNDS
ncbi:catalase family protein [aff. Roholtiella sp. LEGE 12411]|uniref:catalase family protein n=1 Tax=aff. Roholtiella sp. LEGE 12411 TaxID=1828822 RepID=UPI0018826C4D|nr:catalase family protein [aff. Roholtiella sp. LEGE 12411]MBE9035078.1 catalase family protein [aff. Roholtiella sp. LEGE 12411]